MFLQWSQIDHRDVTAARKPDRRAGSGERREKAQSLRHPGEPAGGSGQGEALEGRESGRFGWNFKKGPTRLLDRLGLGCERRGGVKDASTPSCGLNLSPKQREAAVQGERPGKHPNCLSWLCWCTAWYKSLALSGPQCSQWNTRGSDQMTSDIS